MLHKCDFTLGYKHQCGQCVNLAVDPPALHQRCKSLETTHYWHDQHIPIMHCTEYHPDAAQLQQLTSVFLSKFRYHVCIQPLTDEQLQTLQTGLYNMICKKTRLTKGRHTVINDDNPHFGLNIPGI